MGKEVGGLDGSAVGVCEIDGLELLDAVGGTDGICVNDGDIVGRSVVGVATGAFVMGPFVIGADVAGFPVCSSV